MAMWAGLCRAALREMSFFHRQGPARHEVQLHHMPDKDMFVLMDDMVQECVFNPPSATASNGLFLLRNYARWLSIG